MANVEYLKLVTSEHYDKPKFIQWLSEALGPLDETFDLAIELYIYHDIDSAVGLQLDTLGELIGVKRELNFQPIGGEDPTLVDADYRFVLKSKIAQNRWDGTIPGLYTIWEQVFPTQSIKIQDNQDMTCEITFVSSSFTSLQKELIANGYVIPQTQSVRLSYKFGGTFSFRSSAIDDPYTIETDAILWTDAETWTDTSIWDEADNHGFSDVAQITGGRLGSVL